MRTFASILIAASLLAGVAAVPASAEPRSKYSHKHKYKKKYYRGGRYYYRPRQLEYDADRLPIGSGVWWQQMDREDRGGRGRR